jgi:hypothetical protein
MSRARDVASNNLAVDTTPTLQGDLTMGSNSIADGVLGVKNTGSQSELRLYCEVGNAHYVSLKAPAHSAFSGNHAITLPPNDGNAEQFLKTDGSGVTSWSDIPASGGAWNLIQSVSLSSGDTTATVTGMDATYDRYVIMGSQVRIQGGASQIKVYREVSSAYTINAQYSYWDFSSSGSTVQNMNQNTTGQTNVYLGVSLDDAGNNADSYSTFEFYVDKPSDTALNKLYSYNLRHVYSNSPFVKQITGTIYDEIRSAVTGIRFYPNTGSFLGGAIRLYGISNS